MATSMLGTYAAMLTLVIPSGFAHATGSDSLELEGTWYVLVHYRDATTGRDADLWNDLVWVFESEASRLEWVEYPIVVFRDDRKRFRNLPSGRKVRIESSWLPTAKQHLEIREGLKVSTLGERTKVLRSGADGGWVAKGRVRADSASVIGFSETWEIRDPAGLPTFLRSDTMDSARTESLEGVTRFRVREVSDRGRRLEGDFDRDGQQRGTFQMLRAGRLRVVGLDEDPDEDQEQER